jgi:hypothetical protein
MWSVCDGVGSLTGHISTQITVWPDLLSLAASLFLTDWLDVIDPRSGFGSRIVDRNLNVSFASSDVVAGLDRNHENSAVANLAGSGGANDRLDSVVHEVLIDDKVNHDFGQ